MAWAFWARAHERVEHERADDAYAAWESAHRRADQPVEEWLTYLRKVKLELEVQDQTLVTSDKQLDFSMTRRRRSCSFSSRGVYDPLSMQTVLRITFPKIGEFERRQGLVVPSSRAALRGGRPGG